MKTLLAGPLTPDKPICAGPFCDQLGNPGALVGSIIGKLITMLIILAGLFLLLYLILGGYDWLMSGGDKEKLAKAQHRLQNAVIGMLIVFVAFTVWAFISGDVLGILTRTNTGWQINIPHF